ncbi:M28 family metallopeptidase [Cesiribacter andamanensis]|uniref:Arginyl aminopeptidase n=1 Tax=Cesiribacter andamanensis AMV16 TaxID=1279009 RepID=M7NPT5_9BACT|nr:M28 family peptidase [Cesiribacter andamanensis]EMR03725.1 Arginyl aminopeptidase [Cesiribacter andamanensis AMV16]
MRISVPISCLLSVLFSVIALSGTAQSVLPYARKVLDTLSAPGMHGRGYVADGHLKAARYIAGEYQRIGLKSFGNGYFQEFSISVNTFPEEVSLRLGEKALQAGQDFLVMPCSRSLSGRYPVMHLSAEAIQDPQQLLSSLQEARGKVLLIDKTLFATSSKEEKQRLEEVLAFLRSFKNNPSVASLVLTDDKLSWHVSQQTCERPQLVIAKASAPASFQTLELKIESKLIRNLNTQNVAGLLPGKKPGSGVLVFSAHYDHLGRLGKGAYFPGANDNASGIAMLLSLARHYALPANRPDQDLLFLAFGAEEVGLLGSLHYVNNPLVPLQDIRFLINLDITGTGDEGIMVVNGKIFTEEFAQLQALNGEKGFFKQVSSRGEACNSDHCPFYEQGVPSFFIYTLGGIQAYHDIYDRSETLPLTKFEELHRLLTAFTKTLGR